MTRILVTGGAGYVGSVSAEAFIEAGHEVVVLDDLTTGHRAAVPAGAVFHQGSYGDAAFLAPLLESERIEAILHCAARSLVGSRSSSRRSTTGQRRWRHLTARGRANHGRRSHRLLVHGRGLRRPESDARSRRTTLFGRSTRTATRSARSKARLAGTAGHTDPDRGPPLLQRRGRDPRPSAKTTPRDTSHPERPDGRRGGRDADGVR